MITITIHIKTVDDNQAEILVHTSEPDEHEGLSSLIAATAIHKQIRILTRVPEMNATLREVFGEIGK